MTFNESNTVEAYLRDLLCGGVTHHTAVGPGVARRAGKISGLGWHYLAPTNVPRQPLDVFVEPFVRDALIRLNPEIAENPDRAEEVLYKLRAIVLSVRSDGLIKANEEFTAWLRGDRSMPFGPNHEHTTVRLVDFDDVENNHYVVTQQYTFRAGPAERRADLVLLVNGLPLVIIEAKTPVRPSVSWVDGALQLHSDYEKYVPELFACNVFNVASEGKELRYGSVRMPVNLWGPWRVDEAATPSGLSDLQRSLSGLLAPATLLDILSSFTLFATDKKKRRIKIVCRYQQYEAANRIVQRVIAGQPRKGLIWHFQGSGKSLLMVFAAQKLRLTPALKNPTVLIVVDRIDLDSQISATFHASDIPNLVKAESRDELKRKLRQDARKILITTIFKFGDESPLQKANRLMRECRKAIGSADFDNAWLLLGRGEEALAQAEDDDTKRRTESKLRRLRIELAERKPAPADLLSGVAAAKSTQTKVLNDRSNIVVLVDEAHRTQEGNLGLEMRAALPNAFLFGLTGTPINKRDRNTFYAFGSEEDDRGYMSRYSFEESIRDGATLPLHFEPRLIELHIDKDAIDEAYSTLAGELSDLDKDTLAKTASKMAVLVKAPERVAAVCKDIANHYQDKVEPNGFTGMVVTFDQECCLLYKAELDQHLPPEVSEIVISVSGKERDDERYRPLKRDRDAEEALLDRYRDPKDPLQILIVTAKLLTGFDAPVLQAMYLDKPLRDHTLLQAITRTNRTYTGPDGARKGHGLIVDYLGVFDDVAKSL
jgi:type I site-specific restriction-modification system R (restriction) subunit